MLAKRRNGKPTNCDLLVAAARTLSPVFSEAELTVRAWATNPERFGLDEYEQHSPAHKAVMASLLDGSGPVKKGLIERVEPGMYRLKGSVDYQQSSINLAKIIASWERQQTGG